MPCVRCRSLAANAIVAVAVLLAGCNQEVEQTASADQDTVNSLSAKITLPPIAGDTPTWNELDAAAVEIRKELAKANGSLAEGRFRLPSGDAQFLNYSTTAAAFASIFPHRLTSKLKLEHGRPLALITTDSVIDRLRLRPHENYWIAAITNTNDTLSLFYSATADSVFWTTLHAEQHGDEGADKEDHLQGSARWIIPKGFRVGAEEAWAVCSATECCCTGTSCRLSLTK